MNKYVKFSAIALLTIGISSVASNNKVLAATPDKTATVNYVKGYGIATWKNVVNNAEVTGHYLPTNSQWLVNNTVKDNNNRSWYLVGNNEYASEQYYDLGNENSSQSLDASIKIVYNAGSRVTMWATPNSDSASGTAANGAYLRVFERRVVNGQTWYAVGKDQWIKGTYAQLITEQSRGQKTFYSSYLITPSSISNTDRIIAKNYAEKSRDAVIKDSPWVLGDSEFLKYGLTINRPYFANRSAELSPDRKFLRIEDSMADAVAIYPIVQNKVSKTPIYTIYGNHPQIAPSHTEPYDDSHA